MSFLQAILNKVFSDLTPFSTLGHEGRDEASTFFNVTRTINERKYLTAALSFLESSEKGTFVNFANCIIEAGVSTFTRPISLGYSIKPQSDFSDIIAIYEKLSSEDLWLEDTPPDPNLKLSERGPQKIAEAFGWDVEKINNLISSPKFQKYAEEYALRQKQVRDDAISMR